MLLPILIAAAQPVAAPASGPVVVALVAGDGEARCLPDRSLCLELPGEGKDEGGRELRISSPGSGDDTGTISLPLPYGADGKGVSLWPNIIPVPSTNEDAAQPAAEFLVGVIEEERAMYSGGGGSGGRLHLLRVGVAPHAAGLVEVLDTVWDSSLMIRACFSEQDMKNRLEACHDEYSFTGALAAAAPDGGELPALTLRTAATAYPQTSRRTEDNSNIKLKKSDLTHWKDPECSYTRLLHYNPATARYEMDRPAPDCSVYTTP
ncbi:hypothetical protein [Sphingopyxis macrogoltabida]|uniref:Uncharacterized protein n=1 Tax=Sphingopyxis macrogoltabida TaxID=33050 RepID=A0AAC9AW02_SPHMC|nr:hypothetical protein [Sphingopyxis macrogoltabida]ALJ14624.1 cobalt-zinc-cadmium resistance protein CzcA [Sphingopyxis macrogoltabida]AMU90887.1 hypothetical protein ATM17_17845 [Sphingopyxis macrogoltabida]